MIQAVNIIKAVDALAAMGNVKTGVVDFNRKICALTHVNDETGLLLEKVLIRWQALMGDIEKLDAALVDARYGVKP